MFINYPVPTSVKEVCVSMFLSIQSQRFPHLAFSHPFIYHPWISCNPPDVSSFDSDVSNKLPNCHSPERFSSSVEVLLPGNCHQFGSENSYKTCSSAGCSFVDRILGNTGQASPLAAKIAKATTTDSDTPRFVLSTCLFLCEPGSTPHTGAHGTDRGTACR